jgi:plasmid stabilization system protein ParE
MAVKITWTKRALEDLSKVMNYLLENWGEKSAKEFSENLDKKLTQISAMPEMYPRVLFRKSVRKCVLTPQNTLYYKIKDEKIEIRKIQIITIFDNRQNPEKLKI